MQLRDFSTQARGSATLVCAPYALHRASVVDFAPGHTGAGFIEAMPGKMPNQLVTTNVGTRFSFGV